MSMLKRFVSCLAVSTAGMLAACGGGGGSSGGSTTLPVANLTLTLSAASVTNSGSETITATVTATNANNQTMSAAPVVFKVNNEAAVAAAGSSTGTDGRLSATVSIGENRSNRTITVTASANSGALTVSKTFQVVGAKLTATAVPTVVAPSAAGAVKYRLLDANSNPMPGASIVVNGPGGVETTGTTSLNGDYDYAYTAPAATGDLTLKASSGGVTLDVVVVVQTAGSASIPVVNSSLTPVRSASLSASPSVVAVNTASTSNQSQLRALFLTEANAPVKNIRVRFDLGGDANSIGGTISTGSNLAYTDANGVVSATYVPGTRSSPTDGLTVRACWSYGDFAEGACPNHVTTTLTVVADPVSVSIGTNSLLSVGSSQLTYVKRYVVQVVDSSGVAKPDVQVTASIDLPAYLRGFYILSGDKWVRAKVGDQEWQRCANEDLNRNGVLEKGVSGQVLEDKNQSGVLEPQKSLVAVSFDGASKTDSSGIVVVRIEYPQDHGAWVEFDLVVSASGVSGTEGRAVYNGILPVPAPVLADKSADPPFRYSPFGVVFPVSTFPEYRVGFVQPVLLCGAN